MKTSFRKCFIACRALGFNVHFELRDGKIEVLDLCFSGVVAKGEQAQCENREEFVKKCRDFLAKYLLACEKVDGKWINIAEETKELEDSLELESYHSRFFARAI